MFWVMPRWFRREPRLIISVVLVPVCVFTVCLTLAFQGASQNDLFFPSAGGSRRPGTTGMRFTLASCDYLMNVTVCVSPSRIVGKTFKTHEIPGIVFFPSRQIQQAFQYPSFLHQEWAVRQAKYAKASSVPLVFQLNMSASVCPSAKYTCSISAVIKSQLALAR